MPQRPVTGGDLYELWKVSRRYLPRIENKYNKVTRIHVDDLSTGDEETFGRAYPAWHELQQLAHTLMYQTAFSLQVSRQCLGLAIEEFTHVDGETSGALNQLGRDLESDLSNPDHTVPGSEVDVVGEPVPPNEDDNS